MCGTTVNRSYTTCTGHAGRYLKGGAEQFWAIVTGRGLACSGANWKGKWLVLGRIIGRDMGWARGGCGAK